MTRPSAYVETPYYVLMDGKRRFGPEVAPLPSGTICLVVYGFSDKGHYDKFCKRSQVALTPYPLTNFYLQEQAAGPGGGLNLVVVDAAGPDEPSLQAGTMEAVLLQEDRTTHVAAAYDLTFVPEDAAYRVTVNKQLKSGIRR